MKTCDICFENDDKYNHCGHCDRNICQNCSTLGGPNEHFYCEWNIIDGTICLDCIWRLKRPTKTYNLNLNGGKFDPANPNNSCED